jgi:hypothetical protein
MWNANEKKLAALASTYPSAVLTVLTPSGYPYSVRCSVELDEAERLATFKSLPTPPPGVEGKACLLFHAHNERLEGLRQMVIKGELAEEKGRPVFRIEGFVTANGRSDTDLMPHAGAPLHMLRFLLLGRRKAREYITKRGAPWPPIPYDDIRRKMLAD